MHLACCWASYRLVRGMPEVLHLTANGWMPNNPRLPMLLYRQAVPVAGSDPAAAFEILCARYLEVHSRQLGVTPPEIAELMADLADGARRRCRTRAADCEAV